MFLGFVFNVYGQQHAAYNGISLEGKLDNFSEKLLSKGFRLVEEKGGEKKFKGVSPLLKDSIELYVFASPITDTVSFLYEIYNNTNAKQIDDVFKKVTKAFTKQYGKPELNADNAEYILQSSTTVYGLADVTKKANGVHVRLNDRDGVNLWIKEGDSELYSPGKEAMLENMCFHGIAMGQSTASFKESLIKHGFSPISGKCNEFTKHFFANYTPAKIELSENSKGKNNEVRVAYSFDSKEENQNIFKKLKECLDTLIRDRDSYYGDFVRYYNVSNVLGENVGSIELLQYEDTVFLAYRDAKGCYNTAKEALANKSKRSHLTFMGIPITGNVVPFFTRLVNEKGFKALEKNDGCLWFYKKEWAGEKNVQLLLAHYSKKQLLYAVDALISCPDNDAGSKMDNFASIFTRKLGAPDIDDGGGYSYNVYSWGKKVGRIYLQTRNERLLSITYYDADNVKEKLKEEKKDLF